MAATRELVRADGLQLASRTPEQILNILGGSLPRCIRESVFTPEGFIEDQKTGRKLIPVY